MKFILSALILMSFAQAGEVDFRKHSARSKGTHKIVLTQASCEQGQSECRAMDREGIVRLEIGPRKAGDREQVTLEDGSILFRKGDLITSGDGEALFIYDKSGKIVSMMEDDSQLIAFVGQLRIEMKKSSSCKMEVIIDQNNEVDSSVVKCP